MEKIYITNEGKRLRIDIKGKRYFVNITTERSLNYMQKYRVPMQTFQMIDDLDQEDKGFVKARLMKQNELREQVVKKLG